MRNEINNQIPWQRTYWWQLSCFVKPNLKTLILTGKSAATSPLSHFLRVLQLQRRRLEEEEEAVTVTTRIEDRGTSIHLLVANIATKQEQHQLLGMLIMDQDLVVVRLPNIVTISIQIYRIYSNKRPGRETFSKGWGGGEMVILL